MFDSNHRNRALLDRLHSDRLRVMCHNEFHRTPMDTSPAVLVLVLLNRTALQGDNLVPSNNELDSFYLL